MSNFEKYPGRRYSCLEPAVLLINESSKTKKVRNFSEFQLTKIVERSRQLTDSPLHLDLHTEDKLLIKCLEQYFILFKPAVSRYSME